MVAILTSLSILLLGQFQDVCGEQEHKVHNIVLYPEKHSWCQTTPIQQVVASPGYEPVTIQNNVCVGACFSYSIPKSEPAEPGELIGPYCDSCQPSQIECYHVNLHTDNINIEGPKILQKRVQIIMNCSCQSCDKIRTEDCAINDTNTLELPRHLFIDLENLNKSNEDYIHPDLFDAQNSQNKQHFENDVKLKNKLKKWFEDYQSDGHETKNSELEDLEKSINAIEKKNDKINKDLEGLPKSFGLEGAPSHLKGAHIGMGIIPHPNDVVVQDTKKTIDHKSGHHGHHHQNHHVHHNTEESSTKAGHHHHLGEEQHFVVQDTKKTIDHKSGHHGHHHQNHHVHHNTEESSTKAGHHHHLGEEQHFGTNIAHLVRGPHGSMVAAPTEVKLHIDSDSLKPNDEGLVVEYENHHHKDPLHKVADLMETD